REIPGQIETERVVVDITKFTKTGDRSLLPNLEPNDTIIINPKFWSRFQESTTWLDVIYRVAMIYFLVQR
nr:hypothetical protein [FCB group bacterium]